MAATLVDSAVRSAASEEPVVVASLASTQSTKSGTTDEAVDKPNDEGRSVVQQLVFGALDIAKITNLWKTAEQYISLSHSYRRLELDKFPVQDENGNVTEKLMAQLFLSRSFKRWFKSVCASHTEADGIKFLETIYTEKKLATMLAMFRRSTKHYWRKKYAKRLQRAQFDLWYDRMVSPSELTVGILGLEDGIADTPSIERDIVFQYQTYRYIDHKKEDQNDGW
uniref:Uncharacterized protein n=1 Tax=Peronospora matthiolae TaxID=2874970 RepID=A0AAV1TRZ4_9STRA